MENLNEVLKNAEKYIKYTKRCSGADDLIDGKPLMGWEKLKSEYRQTLTIYFGIRAIYEQNKAIISILKEKI